MSNDRRNVEESVTESLSSEDSVDRGARELIAMRFAETNEETPDDTDSFVTNANPQRLVNTGSTMIWSSRCTLTTKRELVGKVGTGCQIHLRDLTLEALTLLCELDGERWSTSPVLGRRSKLSD